MQVPQYYHSESVWLWHTKQLSEYLPKCIHFPNKVNKRDMARKLELTIIYITKNVLSFNLKANNMQNFQPNYRIQHWWPFFCFFLLFNLSWAGQLSIVDFSVVTPTFLIPLQRRNCRKNTVCGALVIPCLELIFVKGLQSILGWLGLAHHPGHIDNTVSTHNIVRSLIVRMCSGFKLICIVEVF